jgi:S-disulfanyl-L-cysteine oxidoreductase SoxD
MRPSTELRAGPSTARGAGAIVLCAAMYSAAVAVIAAQAPARTVWDGVYTAAQAERGQAQYAASCARCHGGSLEGGMGRALVGTQFWNKWREQSVGDLLDYVSKNMPMGVQATTLSPPVYADLVAYLLRSNELPVGPADLTVTSGTDARIVAKDGGTGELPPSTLARVVGCLERSGADGAWRVSKASRPERVKSIGGALPPSAPGGDRRYELKFVLQPLAPLVGQQVAVVGILIGDGGADGINVSTVAPVRSSCD